MCIRDRIATFLAAAAAAWVDSLSWAPNAKAVVSAVIGAIWLLLVCWLTLWPFLTWLSTHFVVTDRRVMFRHGVATRSGIGIVSQPGRNSKRAAGMGSSRRPSGRRHRTAR